MNTNDENAWRTPAFRSSVVGKIEEAIQKSGVRTLRSSTEVENNVFQKSRTKDEYLSYASHLIKQLRESSNNMRVQMSGQPMQQCGQRMQDPMNALRAMAHPGCGDQMNAMPQQGQMHSGPVDHRVNIAMANQMNAPVNSPVGNANVPGGQMMNAMSGQMVNRGPMPNQMTMSGQMNNTMNVPMHGQMGNTMNAPMGQQVHSPMQTNIPPNQMNMAQMNHLAAQRKMMPDGMMLPGQGNVAYMSARGPVPNQYIRQNIPSPQPSPVAMNPVGSMVPSPALVLSPGPAQLPCTGGMVGPMMRQSGPSMVPSPSSSISLNTPGNQSQPTPSPCGNDEQAYRDKVKQLSRYIEPLRKMISPYGNSDSEKISKMRKLLEILTSPGQRVTMETLLKCEIVLEKLDIKFTDPQVKEQHPLIEAVSTTLQSPNPNHTFHRTFEPIMTTLNGKPLRNLPRAPIPRPIENTPTDVMEVLQGEVARLDQRFKVSLDPVQQSNSKSVHLTCWLDDRHLPCLPLVQISVPEDYPISSPTCNMSDYEYGATNFLQMIQKTLQARISQLPARFTLSQLLDTWEMSVRETCRASCLPNEAQPFVMPA